MKLAPLFQPESLVVVGVSRSNDRHPANVVFNKNRHRYPLRVYGVNPRGGTAAGARLYTSLDELPEAPDLAVVVVRAEQVIPSVEACIRRGVKGAVVLSGGFAEVGRRELQDRLVALCREADFPLVGPNCLGVYAPGRVDTLFLPPERTVRPQPGNVALVSQSGGVLVDQMLRFAEEGIGLSLGVSIGNKAVLGEAELLRYLAADPATRVVAFYLEGFGVGEGRAFVEAARAAGKPVVVLKAGRSARGSRAVSSHTASLAGDHAVFSAALAQYGLLEARDEHELAAYCEALSCYGRPLSGSPGLGILTGSGGHGALAVDACAELGLDVPALPAEAADAIREALSPRIRSIATVSNPLDLTGSAGDDDFVAAARGLLARPELGALLVLLLPYLPGTSADVGARLARVQSEVGKPLVAYVPHVERYRMIVEGFELNRVPVAHSIEAAVHMARALWRDR